MTRDDRIVAIFTAVIIASVIALATCSIASMAGAKELPLLVDVSELGEEYDNQRVAVMGWARSAIVKRGRMGSSYVSATVGEEDHEVTVFIDSRAPSSWKNKRVIIHGIYHEEGWFGGFMASNFIIADTIVRDFHNE